MTAIEIANDLFRGHNLSKLSCFYIHVYGLIILGKRERRQKQEEAEEEEAES